MGQELERSSNLNGSHHIFNVLFNVKKKNEWNVFPYDAQDHLFCDPMSLFVIIYTKSALISAKRFRQGYCMECRCEDALIIPHLTASF